MKKLMLRIAVVGAGLIGSLFSTGCTFDGSATYAYYNPSTVPVVGGYSCYNPNAVREVYWQRVDGSACYQTNDGRIWVQDPF